MDTCSEECEAIHPDSELTTLDSTEPEAADNEDEVEALHNSLKEIVHDQDVQPKLQCIMMDPSFSMVTVQGDESSIVWETPAVELPGGSECSTPWTSESGITSEGYSIEGSGMLGQITIVIDEDKARRGKGMSSGAKGSEKSGSNTSVPTMAASGPGGAERPAMTEVSVPNIRGENTGDESVDPYEEKEQQLFSIVSEGFEILNIVVPSQLLTVDEEESNQMDDNLFYLEECPKIKSKQILEEHETIQSSFEINILGESQLLRDEQISKQNGVPELLPQPLKPDTSFSFQSSSSRPMKTDGTSGVDYFEKFTLMYECSPEDYPSGIEEHMSLKPSETSQIQEQEESIRSPSEGQENFDVIDDIEIPSERIDEIFYGCSYIDEREKVVEEEAEQPKSPLKASGSALFGSEEATLSPIFLSPGPPKIVDLILLEEPAAMSFLYSDLYAEALGSRKTEDETLDEVESIASTPQSFEGWFSDVEDANGYLEKFTLIDEIPVIACEPSPDIYRHNGLGVQSQNPLQLLSALTPVQEEVEEEVTKADKEYCKKNAPSLEKINGEVAKKVTDLYKEMSQCIGENKKFKLELIHRQIGAIKKRMESAREALEMTLRMMEESTSKDPGQSLCGCCS
ncbi:cardiomyopathy-associated protein 5-like isoform X2 [Scleropages formosus]|uniref:cardiomyopathy-associated protein 5-like isoform X2 n=1 Tax=Scleropages formosus TaxID=113540 RepID=UPI0010FA9948|nr:cardiomyopathy-associated protein 5 isoform X2 [Scleropages formosus]